MTVVLLGAGNMGTGLARRLAAAGEEVVLIARDEAKTRETAKSIGKNVRAAGPSAAAEGDVVILAVPYPNVGDAIREAGGLAGKTVVDITNAVGPNLSMAVTGNSSGAQEIQKLAPQAKVVKAFNTIFAPLLDLDYKDSEPPQVLVAGDDAAAKDKVAALIRKIGFEPIDCGPLDNARQIEALGNLNIRLGYTQGFGRQIAFGITRY